jgi:tetratricopeptide (TPR) repeat protein
MRRLLIGVALFAALAVLLLANRPDSSVSSVESGLNRPADSVGGEPAPLSAEERLALKRELDRHFERSVMLLHARRFDYALVAIEQVLSIAPRLPEGHVNLGYALLGLERHGDARTAFLNAIGLRSDQHNAYYGLALAEQGLGNLVAALTAIDSWLHTVEADNPYHEKAITLRNQIEQSLISSRARVTGGGLSE